MHLDASAQSENHGARKRLNGKVHIHNENDVYQKPVKQWSYVDVADWLSSEGFANYADRIAFDHKIDGSMLLMLTERDLREKPLEMSCLGDIKRMANAISMLRDVTRSPPKLHSFQSNSSVQEPVNSSPFQPSSKIVMNGSEDMLVCVEVDDGVIPIANADSTILAETSRKADHVLNEILSKEGEGEIRRVHVLSREELIRKVESPDTKIKSLVKLIIAFCYCSFSLLITAFTMVIVNDRVPDMKTYPPLPDIVLDNLPLIPWAFQTCELIAVCLSTIWFTVLFFHKHRVVIMRRMFSLTGTVFLLRCVTMIITSLSVPGVHLDCRAKTYGSLSAKLWHAFHIWSKLGMSIRGVRTCGDYMFSGHTTAITLLNHLITEYTPDTWHGLHTTTWVLNLFGIFFILAGHEHYSIDVFIAFYISSRMFLYYHAYAYNHYNLTSHDGRMRVWFPLGWFFEAGGHGRMPNEFEWPLSFPGFHFKKWQRQPHPETVERSSERKTRIPPLSLDHTSESPENNNKSIRRRKKR